MHVILLAYTLNWTFRVSKYSYIYYPHCHQYSLKLRRSYRCHRVKSPFPIPLSSHIRTANTILWHWSFRIEDLCISVLLYMIQKHHQISIYTSSYLWEFQLPFSSFTLLELPLDLLIAQLFLLHYSVPLLRYTLFPSLCSLFCELLQ